MSSSRSSSPPRSASDPRKAVDAGTTRITRADLEAKLAELGATEEGQILGALWSYGQRQRRAG